MEPPPMQKERNVLIRLSRNKNIQNDVHLASAQAYMTCSAKRQKKKKNRDYVTNCARAEGSHAPVILATCWVKTRAVGTGLLWCSMGCWSSDGLLRVY